MNELTAIALVGRLRAQGFDAREGFRGVVNIFWTMPMTGNLGCHANACGVWFTYDKDRWVYFGPTAECQDWCGKSFKAFDANYIKSLVTSCNDRVQKGAE